MHHLARGAFGVECLDDLGELVGELESIHHRSEVQPGPSDQERPLPSRLDVRDHPVEGVAELDDREVLRRLHEVDQMVRDLRLVGGTRLRGADVHAAVHLHRVDRHDLPPGVSTSDLERKGRLPGRRGPHDGELGRPRRRFGRPSATRARGGRTHRALTAIRVRWAALASIATKSPLRWWAAAPVMSTRTYVPGLRGPGAAKCTSLLCSVRAVVIDRVTLRRPLDDCDLGAPDARPMLGERTALDDDTQTFESFDTDRMRHETIGELGRFGPGTGRVDERVGAVVLGLGGHLERAGEVGLGLAREPDDDVGGHGQVSDGRSGRCQPIEVALGGVAPVHRSEDPVAARLERQVEVVAHLGGLGHGVDGLGTEVLRMRTRVADSSDAVEGCDLAKQVGEQRPDPHVLAGLPGRQGEVAPVAVHVLPQQGHLGDAVGSQRRHLCGDLAGGAADLGTAHGRNDAEGTRVVAADLDRDPPGPRHLASGRQRARERRTVFGDGLVEHLDHRTVLTRLGQQRGGPVDVVGAEDDIDVRGSLGDEVAVLLGQAAADHDLEIRVGVLARLQVPEGAVELVVGVLADAAGVEDDDVGLGIGGGPFVSVGFEQAGDALGVVLVHLTPEGADDVGRRGHAPCRLPARTTPEQTVQGRSARVSC